MGLGNWQVARGQTSMWQVIDGVLEGRVDTGGTITELVPIDAVWQSDWRNYELELDLLPAAGVDRNLAWGYQNPQNWYEIHFLPSFFELARLRNQNVTWSESGNFILTSGVWHHLKLYTAGGSHKLWVDGVLVFDLADPDYEGGLGKPALKVGTGSVFPTVVKFDNVSVRLVSDPREIFLPVPAVRQDDPVWAMAEYDSALAWSGTAPVTIERWGCALTSAVMLLRFYGFEKLLDGTPMTPASLNQWLLTQVDGYLGHGWVNWVALVRLTRELRETWSTLSQPLPQLRYARQGWADWLTVGKELILQQLTQGRPAILELPGHFVVAHGSNFDQTQLLIRDPASSVTTLEQLNVAATSARLWQPSYDPELMSLSYWVILIPRGLRVKLFDDLGVPVTNWWLSQDAPGTLGIDQSQINPLSWQVLTVPQPPQAQKIRLEIARATGDPEQDGAEFWPAEAMINLPFWQPLTVKFLHYDDQAEVRVKELTVRAIETPQVWELDFTYPAEPMAKLHWSWFQWREMVRQSTEQQLLPPPAAAKLNYVAALAQAMETVQPDQLTNSITNQRYGRWLIRILAQTQTQWPESTNLTAIDFLHQLLQDWLQLPTDVSLPIEPSLPIETPLPLPP